MPSDFWPGRRKKIEALPLDAPDWKDLHHAYGAASDVPKLLQDLALNPQPKSSYDSEPWFMLWSSLCHQGTVYTASYAAVPHIVDIGLTSTGPIDFSFFQLPACIEIARAKGRGPTLPEHLAGAYLAALKQLHECAFKHASDEWDEGMALSVAAALAAAQGQLRVAEAIINLDGELMDRIIDQDF